MKIVRKSILVNLVLAVICGTSMPWARSVKAEFAPLECVSGNCQIITQVQDTDLLKTFPASNTKVRLRLDTRNLLQANSTQETFSYRAYEINGSGQKEIISKTYVKFPTKAKNTKDYQVDLDIKPFIGTKKIYVEWFTSNDELALTNSFNVKATGSYANNQAESLNIGGSSVDKDAMIDFFVNNVKWTANTRGDAKAISVVPDQDTGTVEVNIPIIPSGVRAPLKRRKVSYNETGTGSGTGSTPVTTGGNASMDDADFPLILENGNIMALTSSQDPSVPVLVITSNRRIGINDDTPLATLDIAPGNNANALPIMRFGATPLVSAPVNGAFEYDTAGDLYFTSNGVRKYFVLNPNSSSAVKKLESSSNPGKFLTLSGVNDVVLNGTAGVTLNLPSANGTLARLEDLGTLPPSSVDASEIANASITNPKLAADAVTSNKILDGTITGADIADGTINANDITVNSLTSTNILDGTITLSDLSTAVINAFDSKKLLSSNLGALSGQAITFDGLHNAVFQSNGSNVNLLLPAGSGTLARLSDIGAPGAGSVTTAALADGSVTNVKLAADAVTSNKILDGTITGADIANATITNVDIAANTVNSGNILDGTIALIDLAANSVNSSKIVNGSILPADLDPTVFSSFIPGAGSITTTSILDGTILTADLADGSVTNIKLGASAVTTEKILDGTVTSLDIADAAITGTDIAANTIGSINIIDGSVTNIKLGASAVTTEKILDGTVTSLDIANGTITGTDIAANTIGSLNIIDGSVTNIKLGANAVTSNKILDGTILPVDLDPSVFSSFTVGTNSVTSTSIVDATIQAVDLANGSVTNPKLADGAVDSVKIGDGTIQSVDLADASITTNKIAISAVTALNIANNAVTNTRIGPNAVTSDKIDDGTIQTQDLGLAIITQDRLALGAVTSVKIADGTVALVDLANDSVDSNKIVNNSILTVDLHPSVFSSFTVGANTITTTAILDGTIQTADLADGSVTNNKIVSVDASKITGTIPVTLSTAKGVLAGSTLSFTPDHSYFTKTMTANTTFTATNLTQGHRYVLKLSGAFIPTFPAYFVLNPERTYNPQLQNYFQFEVIDDSVGTPFVLVRLNQQPI